MRGGHIFSFAMWLNFHRWEEIMPSTKSSSKILRVNLTFKHIQLIRKIPNQTFKHVHLIWEMMSYGPTYCIIKFLKDVLNRFLMENTLNNDHWEIESRRLISAVRRPYIFLWNTTIMPSAQNFSKLLKANHTFKQFYLIWNIMPYGRTYNSSMMCIISSQWKLL